MSENPTSAQHTQHPTVSEHPEQRRQEETGHEDAGDPGEVGRPPSKGQQSKSQDSRKSNQAA